MENQNNIEQLIQDYVSGSLSREEEQAFENRIQVDSELKLAVYKEKLARELVIRNVVTRRFSNMNLAPEGPRNYFWRKIATAGVIIGIGLIAFMLFMNRDRKQQTSVPNTKEAKPVVLSEENKETVAQETAKDESEVISKQPVQQSNEPVKKKELKEVPTAPDTAESTLEAANISKELAEEITLPVQEQKIIQENNPVPVPCKLDAEVYSSPACSENHDGKVVVDKVSGGIAPYRVLINGQEMSRVNNASSGLYKIRVQDAAGCVSDQEVVVEEKVCADEIVYVYNATGSNEWAYPVTESFSGIISIVDKTGNPVWKERILYGSPHSWKGQTTQGGKVVTGAYIVILKPDNREAFTLTLNVINQ